MWYYDDDARYVVVCGRQIHSSVSTLDIQQYEDARYVVACGCWMYGSLWTPCMQQCVSEDARWACDCIAQTFSQQHRRPTAHLSCPHICGIRLDICVATYYTYVCSQLVTQVAPSHTYVYICVQLGSSELHMFSYLSTCMCRCYLTS